MAEVTTVGTLEQALARAAHLLDRDPVLTTEQRNEILTVVAGHPGALRLLGRARLLHT